MIACSEFFLAHFSFFLAFVVLLPFVFHILSDSLKKLGDYYGQSLEMGTWSITGISGHFTAISSPKLLNVVCQLLHQNAIDIQNHLLMIDQSLLYYLLIMNTWWSQPLSDTCAIGSQMERELKVCKCRMGMRMRMSLVTFSSGVIISITPGGISSHIFSLKEDTFQPDWLPL